MKIMRIATVLLLLIPGLLEDAWLHDPFIAVQDVGEVDWPTPVASYEIEVELDPESKTLTGRETITYLNESSQAIPDLVFHLYLNAFRSIDSIFLQETGRTHRGFPWYPNNPGWIEVDAIRLADDGTILQLEALEDGTLARANLPEAIPPAGSITLEVDFHALLPRVFARTGFVGDFFMVGQWFPKLGVWEEGGWNAYPFHANNEFYANYGNYDISIRLPERFLTAAVGLPVAEQAHGDGSKTVRYHADAVIDFAWAASPNFLEASRMVGETEILYVYLPEHEWTVERVLATAEAALERYGAWYGPYVYPRLTVLDVPEDGGGAAGMEYPTLVTAGVMSALGLGPGVVQAGLDLSLEMVTAHEIGHQWWHTMVAFNEVEEPWMDEGFTDYSTARLMSEISGGQPSAFRLPGIQAEYLDLRRAEYLASPRLPMFGRAFDFGMLEYSIATYSKPVVSLLTLQGVLGEEVMLEVMRAFFERFQFTHPDTEDFRQVSQQVTGVDLSWFFDGLVYGEQVVNYTVSEAKPDEITVVRQGELNVPAEIQVTFQDGSTTLERWDGLQGEITYSYGDRPPILKAVVDPELKLKIDLRWFDNGLSRQPDIPAWLALVTRMIYRIQDVFLVMGGL